MEILYQKMVEQVHKSARQVLIYVTVAPNLNSRELYANVLVFLNNNMPLPSFEKS